MSIGESEAARGHKHTRTLDGTPDGHRLPPRSDSQASSAPGAARAGTTHLSTSRETPVANSRHVTSRARSRDPHEMSSQMESALGALDPHPGSSEELDQVIGQNGFADPASPATPPLSSEDMDEEHYVVPSDEWDLGAPVKDGTFIHSLESFSDLLFAEEHLKSIFADQTSMLNFTSFVSTCRPESLPLLKYYLDAMESLKAVKYALSVAESMKPVKGHPFTTQSIQTTLHDELEARASQSSVALTHEVLPSFVTQMYVQTVKSVMAKRIMTTVNVPPREALEGILEAFCLTDPSRADNPIVFASEGFHQMTQYNMNYVIGRNCRFLQGPKTGKASLDRIRSTLRSGQDHCELILNYRRDGSPFVNLLMMCNLRDISGKIRYVLGAQIDVSNLAPDTTDLEDEAVPKKVSENLKGDETQYSDSRSNSPNVNGEWNRPGILLRDASNLVVKQNKGAWVSSKLGGFYQNYLLVRPYPSLRILFASPSLQMPGMLQSPIIDKIGANAQVRDELVQALARGRSVTAKVRWAPRQGDRGRSRWIAFTPLVGSHKQIGVWIAILIDEDSREYRPKQAPPVRFRQGKASREIASKDIIASIGPILEESPTATRPATAASRDDAVGAGSGNRVSPDHMTEVRRIRSLRKALPPTPVEDPHGRSMRATSTSPNGGTAADDEEGEHYETLEERLRKKRDRDAARLLQNPGQVVKPTYKSLSPYAFMNNNA